MVTSRVAWRVWPSSSVAVTVRTLLPGSRGMSLANHVVVPVAMPLAPRLLLHVTLTIDAIRIAGRAGERDGRGLEGDRRRVGGRGDRDDGVALREHRRRDQHDAAGVGEGQGGAAQVDEAVRRAGHAGDVPVVDQRAADAIEGLQVPAALTSARGRRAGQVVVRRRRRLDQAAGRVDAGHHRQDRARLGIQDVSGGRVDEPALVFPVEAGALEQARRVVEHGHAAGADVHAPEAGLAGLIVEAVEPGGAAAEVDDGAADAVCRHHRPLDAVLVDGHPGMSRRPRGEAAGDRHHVRVAWHHRQVVDEACTAGRIRRSDRERRADGAGRQVHAHDAGQPVERDVEVFATV